MTIPIHRLIIGALVLPALAFVSCKQPPPVLKMEQTPILALTGNETQIFSLNFERVRLLSVYETARNAILGEPKSKEWWGKLTTKTGVDPLTIIDRIAIGSQGDIEFKDPFKNLVIICTGRFDEPQKIVDGFLAFLAEDYLLNPPPFKKADRDGAPVFSTKAQSYSSPDKIIEFNFAFPTPHMMVFAQAATKLNDSLDVIAGKSPGIQKNQAWQGRLSSVDMGAMMWSIGDVPPSVNKFLGDHVKTDPELKNLNNLASAQTYVASVEIGREYLLRLGLVCDNIERATALGTDLKSARAVLPRVFGFFIGDGNPKIAYWQEVANDVFISTELNTTSLSLRMEKRGVEEFVRKLTSPVPTPTPREIPAPFLDPSKKPEAK